MSSDTFSLAERSLIVILACIWSRSAPRLSNLALEKSSSARSVTSSPQLRKDCTLDFNDSVSSEYFLRSLVKRSQQTSNKTKEKRRTEVKRTRVPWCSFFKPSRVPEAYQRASKASVFHFFASTVWARRGASEAWRSCRSLSSSAFGEPISETNLCFGSQETKKEDWPWE